MPEGKPKSDPRRKVVQTHFTEEGYDKLREYAHKNRYSMRGVGT